MRRGGRKDRSLAFWGARLAYHGKNQEKEQHPNAKRYFGQQLDSLMKTTQDRDGSHGGNTPNGQVLNESQPLLRNVLIDPSQELKASHDIDGTQSKRRTDTSDSGNDSETIDQIPHPSPGVFSKNGIKTRAKGHW